MSYLVDGSYELNAATSEAFQEATGRMRPDPRNFGDGQSYVAALDSYKLDMEAWDGKCDPAMPQCSRFNRATEYVLAQARAIASVGSGMFV